MGLSGGITSKSGVGGGITAVVPHQLGIGTFSPLLDEKGNIIRGVKICQDISEDFGLLKMSDECPR